MNGFKKIKMKMSTKIFDDCRCFMLLVEIEYKIISKVTDFIYLLLLFYHANPFYCLFIIISTTIRLLFIYKCVIHNIFYFIRTKKKKVGENLMEFKYLQSNKNLVVEQFFYVFYLLFFLLK